ncbi:MAG: ABC transporter permease [Actinomycetota bacterium]|nr:ABC transporter permease [Actinomycetota bacterium]
MTLVGYVFRDLLRNPRRTLASLVGVVIGVGLFSAVLFFVDGSGASMTARAVKPLTLDMQRVVTSPLGGGVRLEQGFGAGALDVGVSMRVTLTVTNDGVAPAHEVVVRDRPAAPLAYAPGSTTLDGKPIGDVGGSIPLSQGSAGFGFNIGAVAPHASHTITYEVRAVRRVPRTSDLPTHATISTREALTPTSANAPRPTSLAQLADQLSSIPGVEGADPLVSVDMAAGSMSAKGTSVPGPVKLFAFGATYQAHYPSIKILSGRIRPNQVLISAETARVLKIREGDHVTLTLPGTAGPRSLVVSGITDLSLANPLFESRQAGSLEKFQYVPYTLVVDPRVFRDVITPAFEQAAAGRGTRTNSLPLEEVDILLDRSKLNHDPASAVAQTQAVARSVLEVTSGHDYLIDNITNTLLVASGDAAIAKRMFLFLGLPGAILAAILTAYAGALLAGAQRRENALLRVRGARRSHLLYLLALRTFTVAGIGSLLGTALGFASVLALLGGSVIFAASNGALVQSALIGAVGGMLVTAIALYVPGRRLITQEIKQELAAIPRRAVPLWRRWHVPLVVLVGAVGAQLLALRLGAFNVPPGSVYAGQSVSLPLQLLAPPIVAWLAGTLLIASIMQSATARAASSRTSPSLNRLLSGVLWRSITRRLGAMTDGVVAAGLVVGLGAALACFTTVYDNAKVVDARFQLGSDIRLIPNPTGGDPHPTSLAARFRVDGVGGATGVVYSRENSVLTSPANEDVATLAAIDPAAFNKVANLQDSWFVGGSASHMMTALRERPAGVLVNSALAKGLKLKTGDTAKVLFGRGTNSQTRKTVKVLGLFTQFPGAPAGTDMVASLRYYQDVTRRMNADYYLASTTDRSRPGLDRAVHSLRTLKSFGRNFTVETSAATLNKDQSSLTALNVRGLLQLDSFFTFLMAATATAMFVFGLLMQRRREYVTLRAQGLQSREIRILVLAESSISATLGSAIGMLVGVGMASQFILVLRPIFTLPPPLHVPVAELAILASLVLVAAALSSAAAAVLIGRLKPTEMLRDD